MAFGKCWRLMTELLPPKWINPLDLVGPQLKKPPTNVKTESLVQVLKRSSLKSEPGLGVEIAPTHTTALVDTEDIVQSS